MATELDPSDALLRNADFELDHYRRFQGVDGAGALAEYDGVALGPGEILSVKLGGLDDVPILSTSVAGLRLEDVNVSIRVQANNTSAEDLQIHFIPWYTADDGVTTFPPGPQKRLKFLNFGAGYTGTMTLTMPATTDQVTVMLTSRPTVATALVTGGGSIALDSEVNARVALLAPYIQFEFYNSGTLSAMTLSDFVVSMTYSKRTT